MNLLIVEDNDQMRRMIVKLVRGLAEHTFECRDGVEALPAYTMHLPDWVLMDVKMKEMDGISATKQIKASYPEANIIIVTDCDDPDLREAARSAGACEYVTKENLLDLRRLLVNVKPQNHRDHRAIGTPLRLPSQHVGVRTGL
jgi:CheY-like chemotaxis protein